MSSLRALSCAALVLALSAANLAAADLPTKSKGSTAPARTQPDALSVVQKLGSLPLRFEPNQGQTDSRVKYLAHGPGFTLFLTPGEAVLSLSRPLAKQKRERDRIDAEDDDGPPRFETSAVRMRLVGANPDPLITPASPQPGTTNYFLGNDRNKWRTGVPGYDRVGYHAVYPGIDLVFYGNPQRLEYDFAAEPGADVSKIQLAFEGADKIEKVAGDLMVHVGNQTVTVHKPLVYQADKSKPIDAQFVLRADNRVGFALGAYDHSQPLIIDPALTYSSYLGGSVYDNPTGIALDSHGDIVIAGTTRSPDFPVTSGSPPLQGNSDIFLTVLDPLGRHLLYSTYIGGSGADSLGRSGLRLDSFDNVYLAGSTGSLDFPQVNPLLGYGGGSNDGFILIASSNSLLFSSYVGGAGSDSVQSLSLDAAGDIILAGNTSSADFPTLNPLLGYNTVAGIYKWAAADPWFATNNGLLVRNINAVGVDPSNHSTLYASTNGGGIYKSTDAGANWSAANNGLTNFIVRHIEVNPATPTAVYAATPVGIFFSNDGGSSWNQSVNFGARNTFALAVYPTINGDILLAGTNNHILRSPDGGFSWAVATGFSGAQVNKLTIDPNAPSVVYAATNAGLYRSLDTGSTWAILPSPLPNAVAVAVDPFNSNVLYAGSNDPTGIAQGLYKSTDGGVNWARIAGNFVRDVVTSPINLNTLYFTAANGLFRSSDAGASFGPRELPNIVFGQIGIAGAPETPDTLYLGTTGGSANEVFVTKLSPMGAGGVYSTFLGGDDGGTSASGVVSDAAGNAVVTGNTSATVGFPLVNAFQSQNPGCFVSSINSSGSAFLYSTYLGGSTSSEPIGPYANCRAVVLNAAGHAFVTGSTSENDFPLVNPVQPSYGGGAGDLFVTEFTPSGSVPYSTFWGGSGDEDGQALYMDSSGNLYIGGDTGSINFPTVNPIQAAAGYPQNDAGPENAVVMKLNSSGQVVFATYLGGSSGGFDTGQAIIANSNGDVFVTGNTTNPDFPLAGASIQSTDNTGGSGTGFISKIAFFPPVVQLSSNFFNFGSVPVNGQSAVQTLTVTNIGTGPLQFAGQAKPPGTPINQGSAFYNAGSNCPLVLATGNSCYFQAYFQPPSVGVFNDAAHIEDNAADAPQVVNLTGTGVSTSAAASVTPPALHFGNIGVNFTSPSQTVTITSTGTAPLIFNSFTTSDPQFAVSGTTCPLGAPGLNPGFSCTVSVDVTPATATFITGNLLISDDAGDSPQVVSLDVTGIQTQTVTQTLSPTQPTTFDFPNQTYNYTVQFPAGTNFSNVTASVTVGPTSTSDFQTRVTTTFPGAQCIIYNGSGGTCTVFQIKCVPSPCPTSPQPNITVKTAFDTNQPVTNPGFLQAEAGTNNWHNIFTEFLLPKIDGTIKGNTDGFSDFVAVNLPLPSNVQAGTFGGFQAPLAPKNGRVFLHGTTIPVKFPVKGANGQSLTNVTAKLTLTKGQTQQPVKLANNLGIAPNIFKYNPTLKLYEFYLSTTGLPAGQYQLTVFSNSFPAQQVNFTLQ